MLNDVPGIFPTVSYDVRLRNLAHPLFPKVCLYRPEATQVEKSRDSILKGRFGGAFLWREDFFSEGRGNARKMRLDSAAARGCQTPTCTSLCKSEVAEL